MQQQHCYSLLHSEPSWLNEKVDLERVKIYLLIKKNMTANKHLVTKIKKKQDSMSILLYIFNKRKLETQQFLAATILPQPLIIHGGKI